MPRVARARTGVFDDLADQLRFAPKATLLRQIARAERLGGEIDPEENYPEDWLVQRITGYRPDIEDAALLVGKAILTDLSSFVELLCERAELTRADLPDAERVLDIDQVCARWGVDRRTIERYRRRGLVARRVRTGARGGAQLAFMPSAICAFEARFGAELQRSASFSRLSSTEQALIRRRCDRYCARLGWTRGQAAARIAARLGRAHETVLRVIRAHDGDAAPDRAARTQDIDRDGVFERWRDGAAMKELAAVTGRTRSATHYLINTRRARLIRGVELVVTPNSDDARVLEDAAARTGLGVERWEDARAFVEFARGAPVVDKKIERARAMALAHLRWRAHHMIAGLPRGRAASATLDRIETDLRWIARLVVVLVRDEAAVVLRAMEERAGCGFLELTPGDASAWFDVAFGGACGAAVRFDPSRGGRLAAPVTIALSHALAGMRASPVEEGRARAVARLGDWSSHAWAWQAWVEPGAGARRVMERGGEEARLLSARYGMDGTSPRTAEEMEREFGVSGAVLARMERG